MCFKLKKKFWLPASWSPVLLFLFFQGTKCFARGVNPRRRGAGPSVAPLHQRYHRANVIMSILLQYLGQRPKVLPKKWSVCHTSVTQKKFSILIAFAWLCMKRTLQFILISSRPFCESFFFG